MFITLEGMEGCGKSTQCALLVEHFTRLGFDVLRTLEPGGSVLGKELRRILRSRNIMLARFMNRKLTMGCAWLRFSPRRARARSA